MNYIPLSGLSLRDIEYVVAVDDFRNFSRAAERCGVSQAGLSEQVRKLEYLLNVTLFERSRRHVTPTPDGAHLIALGRNILTAARTMIEAARARTGALEGVLRVGVIATLGPYYVPYLLPLLRRTYPELRLQLTENLTGPLLEKLRQDDLDFVMAALPVADTIFDSSPVFYEPFQAVFPNDHTLAKKKILDLSDLRGPDLLLLEDGHCLRDQALEICNVISKSNDQRLATSLEMLWHMIGAGEGYSLIPQLALRHRAEWNDLTIARDLKNTGRTIGGVWRKSDPRASTFQAFSQFLADNRPEDCCPVDYGVSSVKQDDN